VLVIQCLLMVFMQKCLATLVCVGSVYFAYSDIAVSSPVIYMTLCQSVSVFT